MSIGNDNDARLGEEAAEWLLRLDDTDPDSNLEYPDELARNQAFHEWIGTSVDHLRVFLETVETQQRMRLIDAHHRIKVQALLRQRADVIPLHKQSVRRLTHRLAESARGEQTAKQSPEPATDSTGQHRSRWGVAAMLLLIFQLGAASYWWWLTQNAYVTGIGEQRSITLEDGSLVHLNTDSKVEVDFSAEARNLRLVRGEALFIVERDSTRPFTVTAGDTAVRAIGTQFNVRRNTAGTEVAVVEGTVQVTAMREHAGVPTQRLLAGEQAQVMQGKISPRSRQTGADPLAWRQRRLIFHDARLANVAEEFNRYNRTKIRIEGDAAKDILLSGIFDADRPQALMLYAAKSADFAVEPEGDDWVIRSR